MHKAEKWGNIKYVEMLRVKDPSPQMREHWWRHLFKLILIHSDSGCIPEMGMRYLGRNHTARNPKVQYFCSEKRQCIYTMIIRLCKLPSDSYIAQKLSTRSDFWSLYRSTSPSYSAWLSPILIRTLDPVGLKLSPCTNHMGVGVRNNIGSTFTDGRLIGRATSQYNDHLTAAHTSWYSFGLGIQLKFSVPTLSLNQSHVSVNDTVNLQHTFQTMRFVVQLLHILRAMFWWIFFQRVVMTRKKALSMLYWVQ